MKIKSRNARGSAAQRRARRLWLVRTFGIPAQGGIVVVCIHCGRRCRGITKGKTPTWEVDRYPICGHNGGRYRRDNIQIACQKCNRGRCNRCRRAP